MKVSCIGSGYVGIVTGVAFAVLGNQTTVIDIDRSKVDLINAAKSPIFEPGLEEMITRVVGNTLQASDAFSSVGEADVVFMAVGTPSKADGTADLKYVTQAAISIGRHLDPNRFTVVVDKSTVPIGTADLVSSIIQEESGLTAGVHFAVVSNPEFLREGYAVEDVLFPDRIVIGADSQREQQVMRNLYCPILERNRSDLISDLLQPSWFKRRPPVYFETSVKSAEMIKYASNAFLAVKISYINEVARLCEKLGADVLDVARGMGLDSRIGEKFLQVSSGWSGSCFPKDTAEFYATSLAYESPLTIVEAAIKSNTAMHDHCIRKVKRRLKTLIGKNIGILGLTFKPNTDDARQTQASYIIRNLIRLGANVRAYDPQGMEMFRNVNPDLSVTYCAQVENVSEQGDALILLTHWDEFRTADWQRIRRAMRAPYILDTRNFLDMYELQKLGFEYEGLGR